MRSHGGFRSRWTHSSVPFISRRSGHSSSATHSSRRCEQARVETERLEAAAALIEGAEEAQRQKAISDAVAAAKRQMQAARGGAAGAAEAP